ncbi:hypothetical protein V496_01102 [Pseudogymnoascus sp. VKM F-4515 (FW-2607)]|nr:hypothetical protein V496_01102 [Pseudogymnoascus sp. VKM F-4515 (FW-2607)]
MCAVGRRASVAQGRALLSIWDRAFSSAIPMSDDASEGTLKVLKNFSALLRSANASTDDLPPASAHLAPLFGVIARVTGVGEREMAYVYMLSHVKALLSAAVRASVFGPYQAQKLLASREVQEGIEAVIRAHWGRTVEDAGQTVPVMDLWIGRHETTPTVCVGHRYHRRHFHFELQEKDNIDCNSVNMATTFQDFQRTVAAMGSGALTQVFRFNITTVPAVVLEWIAIHPGQTALLVVSGVPVFTPAFLTAPILASMGWGASGPVAGSVAAWIHAKIGIVGARTAFAYLHSAGMGGYGTAAVNGIMQVFGAVSGAVSVYSSFNSTGSAV